MKNLKSIVQYAFMVVLLVGVLGVYSELRSLNSNLSDVSQAVAQTRNVNTNPVHLAGFDFPTEGKIPTATLDPEHYDSNITGKKVVPVVILNMSSNEYDLD